MSELLKEARPQVVHITTPPQSHFEIGTQCLLHGCHVYMEKPFALNTEEAASLIGLAEQKGLKITAGHDDQFRHCARRMRKLVHDGFLGGPPVHMEGYYGYELGASGYAKALLADKQHWVRRLPGGLLQNVISHGIARFAEFFTDDPPQVVAHGFVSSRLLAMGESEIVDELRVILYAQQMTGYFTFSSQMRPSLHQFRIYGPSNGLALDQDQEVLIKLRGQRHKSYLEQFVSPMTVAGQYAGCSVANVKSFLANDFHPKSGMKYLMESFYQSIRQGGSPPIPYREILQTSRIMDEIFFQLRPKMHIPSTSPAAAAVIQKNQNCAA